MLVELRLDCPAAYGNLQNMCTMSNAQGVESKETFPTISDVVTTDQQEIVTAVCQILATFGL